MKLHTALFTRLFLIIAIFACSAFLLASGFPYNALFTAFLCVVLVTELYFFNRNRSQVYDKVLLSILHNDFSSNLPKRLKKGNYAILSEVYEMLKQRQYTLSSRESVYTSILDNVDTAILILRKAEEDWEIFMMNTYFSKLFGVPEFRSWSHLRNKIPALAEQLEKHGFGEMKTSAEIRLDEAELQTFSIRASVTQTFNDRYYVILLDSIQKVVEKKEKQAWINLMNVISHELMNSLTPIQSLSQTLQEISLHENMHADELEDIRNGLSAIANRSNHLQFFVGNYRKLTMLPAPSRSATDVNRLVADCLDLMSPLLKQEHITVENKVAVTSVLMLDQKQMEQVFINLITNSIYALKGHLLKKIFLSSHVENFRVFISISDTGKGIEKEIRDKIFLPFFTTRKDGAGIGLTLSRTIVEAHGGYLSYSPEEGKTQFVVCLIVE
jgi:nitrogen fixation/metabolism regulation signal transduction histidine kinase